RPDIEEGFLYGALISQWINYLRTPQSIAQHATLFEQDLCQLIEQMKKFTFLVIYGQIQPDKVESYRLMVQTRFPNTRSVVERTRFCLWL
ncbi:unnamed protein product, partial [Rotaria sordida]